MGAVGKSMVSVKSSLPLTRLLLFSGGALLMTSVLLYFKQGGRFRLADRLLAREVRDALRGVVSDVDAIEIETHHGNVILRGEIRKAELRSVLAATYSVHGVKSLSDRLHLS